MHEWKNKEVIAGMTALVVLSIAAICLIARREIQKDVKEEIVVQSDRSNQDGTTLNPADAEQSVMADDDFNQSNEAKADNTDAHTDLQIQTSSVLEAKKRWDVTTDAYYTKPQLEKPLKEDERQLEELYGYWADYKLDAVTDLIYLQRVRAMTNSLEGSGKFYYYGETDKNGLPHGKGLAVYENNAYYCGEWKHGLRDGQGMWLQIYPDAPVALNGCKGVIEHSYNGTFQDDYPNGKGQEHIEYDLGKVEDDLSITNVIGSFKDGYYDGELYIMTIAQNGITHDWSANAKKGVYQPFVNKKNVLGKDPVWKDLENADESTDVFEWIYPQDNHDLGIYGLKK